MSFSCHFRVIFVSFSSHFTHQIMCPHEYVSHRFTSDILFPVERERFWSTRCTRTVLPPKTSGWNPETRSSTSTARVSAVSPTRGPSPFSGKRPQRYHVIFTSFPCHFQVIFKSFQIIFRDKIVSFSRHFHAIFKSFPIIFRDKIVSFWCHFGVIFMPFSCHFHAIFK